MSFSGTGNFAQDFIVALGVAAAVTVVFTVMVCFLAQCGPRMFGKVDKKERWFEPSLEEGQIQSELPLVQGTSHPDWNTNSNSIAKPTEIPHAKEFAIDNKYERHSSACAPRPEVVVADFSVQKEKYRRRERRNGRVWCYREYENCVNARAGYRSSTSHRN
ncbi:hypothetical protein F5X96DRAFT_673003 [Biscogniauxia mediterranea]|nr:hypothetical protein F5X96DRAFT_673003 [Biscogniauxia mediterranea]